MLYLMKMHRVTAGGQISLPAEVRHRWATKVVAVEDLGDYIVVRPLPEDPVAAARGALKGRLRPTDQLRAKARRYEAAAGARR
jgi:bifunctional DNA-binding transcriptional regulator/antitoxin component of YhaV-PrlF toxin-antitoxin module